MNTNILNTGVQEFINQNLNSDITSLILKGSPFHSINTKDLIEQIEAKIRCEKKLPTWFNTENIYYSNKLNIEQTSSEVTAEYKSGLISGESIVDLTGGFGVDSYYFSKRFKTVDHCEINQSLSEIVRHNYQQLGVKTIRTHAIDGMNFLKNTTKTYDWIYIDPSRRNDSKGKVFFLNDCLPNVPEHLKLLFKRSKNILIKTSPLLDFSIGIDELKHVKTIHVVALNGEVKELLWILEQDFSGTITIETINLKKEGKEIFNFSLEKEKTLDSNYSQPLTYLYEPNSAILKAGGFHSISNKINVYKLHKHSHLYTSEAIVNFPGRLFKIDAFVNYNKKELKKLGITKANITTRNFPETVEQLRKKFKIKDGGNCYLFFTTDCNENKIILVASKL
ncbi:THUMP-like domain-containing protein [Aestuariibaculum suncheonense]|uniref:Class I SAM-dependent methyltransferase n=1 Tax=Aestuariibaculum suncheonense TaxID=1028745 RepID=A0A8J6Q7H6_9FLAO|nr:class I SAM-dependent methyltransferase [Aestuariibaculum suncheonense]MBD0835376.1 class I SAM-dependent methyltransferase [Aestuariibaculum suncheonense]